MPFYNISEKGMWGIKFIPQQRLDQQREAQAAAELFERLEREREERLMQQKKTKQQDRGVEGAFVVHTALILMMGVVGNVSRLL
jgi:hypothetical protein